MSGKTSKSKNIREDACSLRTSILPSEELNKKDPDTVQDFSSPTATPAFPSTTNPPLSSVETTVEKTRQVLKCFVMMPFGSQGEYERGIIESDFVYNYIICPSIEKFMLSM